MRKATRQDPRGTAGKLRAPLVANMPGSAPTLLPSLVHAKYNRTPHAPFFLKMVSFRALPLLVLASSASAQILGLDLFGNILGLVGAIITPGNAALLDINAILGLLAPTDVSYPSVALPRLTPRCEVCRERTCRRSGDGPSWLDPQSLSLLERDWCALLSS